eukprot:13288929-Heterocapsa_arctica.AAC.1
MLGKDFIVQPFSYGFITIAYLFMTPHSFLGIIQQPQRSSHNAQASQCNPLTWTYLVNLCIMNLRNARTR